MPDVSFRDTSWDCRKTGKKCFRGSLRRCKRSSYVLTAELADVTWNVQMCGLGRQTTVRRFFRAL